MRRHSPLETHPPTQNTTLLTPLQVLSARPPVPLVLLVAGTSVVARGRLLRERASRYRVPRRRSRGRDHWQRRRPEQRWSQRREVVAAATLSVSLEQVAAVSRACSWGSSGRVSRTIAYICSSSRIRRREGSASGRAVDGAGVRATAAYDGAARVVAWEACG